MKKLLIIASLLFVLPAITNASTFVVTPASGSYTSGNTVTLHVSVDPSGSTIYTAMLDAQFTPSKFEVISFTMNDSMLAMKQTGYDSINNTTGTLVKTGGYTGGISSVTPFGTLVLKAKGSGAGNFTVNSTSKLLDANNANKQVGSQVASFTVVASIPVVVPAKETGKIIKTSVISNKSISTLVSPVVIATSTTEISTSTQLASVEKSNSSNNAIFWSAIILIMAGVFITGYYFGKHELFKI